MAEEGNNNGQQTSEGNQQGSQQQGNNQPVQPTVPAGYVPLSERDSAAAAARREGASEGESKATQKLLERYGVEKVEDLDAAIQAAKEREDAEKSAADRLSEREGELSTVKEERKSFKERAERAEDALQTYLEKQREGIREEIVPLLDRMDVVDQLSYISEHGEKLRAEPEPEPQTRRAPDASRRPNPADDNARGRARLSQAFSGLNR